jgi:hypothetical protein
MTSSNGVEWPMPVDVDEAEQGRYGYTDSSFASDNDFIDEDLFMMDDGDELVIEGVTDTPSFPSGALLTNDVQNIPGSPWAQPTARQGSPRSSEPLVLAKYSSTIGLFSALAWVVAQFALAIW